MSETVLKQARAKLLKTAREKAGFTQEEIAKRVKVAKQTYLKWENGDTEPKATQIKLLAENLDITADEICTGSLYKRYSLDDFIIAQSISNAPRDIISLRTWQHIKDHDSFINSLSSSNIEVDDMAEIHSSEVLPHM